MTRRKRMLLWVGLLVVLAGAWLTAVRWASTPRHRISRAGCEAIQAGMTRDEVVEILGAMPGFASFCPG